MKSNIKYILISVLIFFLGALGMYLLISYVPLKTKTITEVNNEYKIEETAVEQAIDKVYDAVVVVESFSNNNTIFFPFNIGCSVPVYLAFFKSAAKSKKNCISLGEKSKSFKKFLFLKLKAIILLFLYD